MQRKSDFEWLEKMYANRLWQSHSDEYCHTSNDYNHDKSISLSMHFLQFFSLVSVIGNLVPPKWVLLTLIDSDVWSIQKCSSGVLFIHAIHLITRNGNIPLRMNWNCFHGDICWISVFVHSFFRFFFSFSPFSLIFSFFPFLFHFSLDFYFLFIFLFNNSFLPFFSYFSRY